jgi:uncharacterized membrane protein
MKGLDGVLELVGGVILFIVEQSKLQKLIMILTQHELAEDPKDILFNYIVKISRDLSVSAQHFGGFYLLSHGIIKLVLIWSLLKRRLWAYPVMVAFLSLFIIYQLYRYYYNQAFYLVVLSVFDLLIIILTIWEYQRLRRQIPGPVIE